ncbi:glycosyltransferase [Roseateles sp. YR242]|uniref:glycosyltransferase n=1 Tax=Roseateles sp. YR242 TaxID=1855305 RepID=UPI0011604C31|nr:glycosyltransferase family 1 protein [Roseateles sp. YR242]
MAKLMVAWEAGGYLGHEMLVTAAALELKHAGHDVLVCAPQGVPANAAARREGLRWDELPGEAPPPAPSTGFRWKSRATSLWSFGFHSAHWLRGRVSAWSDLLAREAPSAVVLQAAPCAQLAARAAGVPSLEFGIGFDVPPRQSPFPPFRNPDAFTVEAGQAFERRLVEMIQQACPVGDQTLAALVSGDRRLVVSLPELDHYAGAPDPSRLFAGPLPAVTMGGATAEWRGPGPRLLAYIRASAVEVPAFLDAAAALPGDWIVVCPDGTEAHAAQATQSSPGRIRFHREPLSLGGLLPQADLVICHGGGLMAEALVHGRPCVAMPIHQEQFMATTAMTHHGLGAMLAPRAPALFADVWRRVLADPGVQANALALSARQHALATGSGQALVRSVQDLLRAGA